MQEILAGWMHVEADEEGHLYVIEEMRALTKLNASSRLTIYRVTRVGADVAERLRGRR